MPTRYTACGASFVALSAKGFDLVMPYCLCFFFFFITSAARDSPPTASPTPPPRAPIRDRSHTRVSFIAAIVYLILSREDFLAYFFQSSPRGREGSQDTYVHTYAVDGCCTAVQYIFCRPRRRNGTQDRKMLPFLVLLMLL